MDKWDVIKTSSILFNFALLLFLIYSAVTSIDSYFRMYYMVGVIALGIVLFGFQMGLAEKWLKKKYHKPR